MDRDFENKILPLRGICEEKEVPDRVHAMAHLETKVFEGKLIRPESV